MRRYFTITGLTSLFVVAVTILAAVTPARHHSSAKRLLLDGGIRVVLDLPNVRRWRSLAVVLGRRRQPLRG